MIFRLCVIWVFLLRQSSTEDLRAQEGILFLSCHLAALSGEENPPSLVGCSHFFRDHQRAGWVWNIGASTPLKEPGHKTLLIHSLGIPECHGSTFS